MYRETFGFPFPFGQYNPDDEQIKQPYDSYDIYVNKDFVGRKMLLNPNDDLSLIDDHLRENGFQHFTTELDGDHYYINVENDAEAMKMKENLNVYLQIR
ncbi:hypothetical protein J2S00_000252 [Caldalkalibacillus uzonensis]|uniref:Uncharacterized protein n=1 Tax=Caldalkalibacillus uzonensis TaxID=353224 RepID=A0ABU0CMU9_9BACI|nr:hypothetical protein [Caldalkalibacillus uzonensis]MDQ0337482.1 hypothetical protein [Caldalkalibacillus uzonensis]